MRKESRSMLRLVKIVGAIALVGLVGLLAYLVGNALRPEPSVPVASAPPGSPIPGRLIEAEQRKPVADIAFSDGDGKTRTLSEFRGRPVLVNFWATWCPPCIAEMPSLDALQAKLGQERLALIALSQDRGGLPVAKGWLDKAGLQNIVPYHADQKAARELGTQAQLPVSILLDKQGREVARVFGAMHWDTPQMVERIAALAGE